MKRFIQILLSGVLCASAVSLPAYAFESIDATAEKVPGIGLILDTVKLDGITISHFRFGNNHQYVSAHPGEVLTAHMHYKIDASALKTLHRHHLIIGLHNDGPQLSVLHSLGIKDAEGNVAVTLRAPETVGVYQVRFCHSEGLTDDEAFKAWDRKGTSAKTIVGIIVVK